MAQITTVREWCTSLAVLTAIKMTRNEFDTRLAAFTPLLADEFPENAFTTASLNAVARQCTKGFPTYPELAAMLSAWWREHRPPIANALPPPEPATPPTPPTPNEIANVEALVQTAVASLHASADAKQRSANEQLAALGVSARPRALHLSPAVLDAINPLPNGRKRAAT